MLDWGSLMQNSWSPALVFESQGYPMAEIPRLMTQLERVAPVVASTKTPALFLQSLPPTAVGGRYVPYMRKSICYVDSRCAMQSAAVYSTSARSSSRWNLPRERVYL
jgi:hypothetical protein